MRLLCALMLFFFIHNLQASEPLAHNGILDLHGWDFAKNGIVELNGQWEFYPWKYYNPKEFFSSNLPEAEYVPVPANWTKYLSGKSKMPVFGYATYRLKIILDSKKYQGTRELAFGMPDMFSAYKLWIDTTLAMAVGIPGKSINEHKPKIVPVTVPLFAQRDTIVITLQIANYFFPQFGGIDRPIKLGLNGQIIEQMWMRNIGYLAGVIFSFTLGIYFFFLFPISQERKINLLFAITCLFVALRYLSDRALIVTLFFPDFDPALRLKLLFMSFDFFPLLLWTAYLFFPDMISRKIVRVSVILFALYSSILLLTPLRLGGRLSLYFVALGIIISIYVTVVSGLAYRQKRESAAIFFWGTLFGTIIFTNNMFVTFLHTADRYYIPVESLLYLVLVASAITLRMVRSREHEIQLSSDLKAMNENLEQLVLQRTEQLVKLNAEKDHFFSIVAHDIKSPLSAVLNISKILKKQFKRLSEDEKFDSISDIYNSLNSSYRYLNNLLDWSRLQLGRFEFKPEVINLGKLTESCINNLHPAASIKNIRLISEVSINIFAFADYEMITVILRNLISNGIKFTRKYGTVKVFVSDKNDYIAVTVQDDGVGIEEENLKKLFSLNSVVKTLGTNNETGTGLGLTISNELIKRNSGEIFVNSCPGEGSSFTFTLLKPEEKKIFGPSI
ncbi:MAG: sensor histidine kinase [Ignavibacteriaceae bacterium]